MCYYLDRERATRVPLAEHCRRVPGRGQLGRQGRHRARNASHARLGVGAVDSGHVSVQHVDVVRVAPALQRRPRRGAVPESVWNLYVIVKFVTKTFSS